MPRSSTSLCLLLSLLGAPVSADESASTPTQFLESWAEAWKSGSVEKLAAFYENSEDVVAIASSGRSHKGIGGVRTMYRDAFGEASWEKVALQGLSVRQDGNIAWCVCRFTADLTLRADRTKLTFTSQGSFVLRKRQGSWKIALEHFSPIPDVPRIQSRSE